MRDPERAYQREISNLENIINDMRTEMVRLYELQEQLDLEKEINRALINALTTIKTDKYSRTHGFKHIDGTIGEFVDEVLILTDRLRDEK